MAKKKKKKNLKQWLIPKLRNHSRIWPPKSEARRAAKRKVADGFFKNGNPKFSVKFECALCKELYDYPDTQMDHIAPAIDVSGFTTWDVYLERLFCEAEGYQCLCLGCHLEKSITENAERRDEKLD